MITFLFLLVVLVTGWGWWHIVMALSVFTLGHAITLTITSLLGFALTTGVVEPVIAATIIAIAIHRLRGNAGLDIAPHSASLLAIGRGSFWLVQRVI